MSAYSILHLMSTPTDLQHFYGSVRAFELANLTDDWTLVALHFFFDAATLAEQIGVGHERFAKALALLGATRS
jgi:hypothetical protein